MPQSSRESIYNALLQVLAAATWSDPSWNLPNGGSVTTFALSGRRILPLEQVPQASMPALFLAQWPSEKAEQNKAWGLTRWHLKAQALIVFMVDTTISETSIPATRGNVILDAIEKALNPYQERQTLGNLVENCWIDGEVIHADGSDDGRAMMLVPISIISG